MKIIPVLDLMNGIVVHARKGERSHYQPLNSQLCPGTSDPLKVLSALLHFYPFKQIYLADLDAITGHNLQYETLKKLIQPHPDIEFWVDSGDFIPTHLASDLPYIPIIGTESLTEEKWAILKSNKNEHYILSLDFKNGNLIGPEIVINNPEHWPSRVILMSLERVGSRHGPDLSLLDDFTSIRPDVNFISAGGVRNTDDLESLSQKNCYAVLVATLLHHSQLDSAVMEKLHLS